MSSIFSTQNNFTVGTRVITTGNPAYHMGLDLIVPVGTIGTIIHVRHRYAGTPNEYKQYKLQFEGYEDGDSLTHLYNSSALKLAPDHLDDLTNLCKKTSPTNPSISIGDFVKVSGHPTYPNLAIN